MCNTGTCIFERIDGTCTLSKCRWDNDFGDSKADDIHDLEDRIFDEYEHGDLTVIQARRKLNERTRYL